MTTQRYRFAPSPTGHLHIGGARTALMNYLMAKASGGKFILRIEDTDRERSTEEYIQSILNAMEWLGLTWDEGPFYQTQNHALYKQHLDKLLTEGKAYRCFCSVEALEEKRKLAMQEGRKPKYDGTCRSLDPQKASQDTRPHCIRFYSKDEGSTVVQDLIRGSVTFDNIELDDLILARTDGTPTYNFVVVVDDVNMHITHIIRGDDHLNNTPRQIQLYEAFNYPTPIFAHVPMILGSDKKRLSKRHGATSVLAYRDAGYLPQALLNYLLRLGWSHGDEEVFSLEDMIRLFDIKDAGKSASVFNPEKLLWLNGHWIRSSSPAELLQHSEYFFAKKNIQITNRAYAEKAIASCQEKVKTLIELVNMATFYFEEEIKIDPDLKIKILDPEAINLLKDLLTPIEALDNFSEVDIEKALKDFAVKKDLKFGKIALPLRIALTGSQISPGIYAVMSVLEKEEVVKRIKAVIF